MRELRALVLACWLAACLALPASPAALPSCRRAGPLRLSGGGAASVSKGGGAKAEAGLDSLKASAKRRAEQAKAAGKAERVGILKTLGRVSSPPMHPDVTLAQV